MDLGTIVSKSDSGAYSNAQDIVNDVTLVWTNAVSFNEEGSEPFNWAKELNNAFNQMVRSFQADQDYKHHILTKNPKLAKSTPSRSSTSKSSAASSVAAAPVVSTPQFPTTVPNLRDQVNEMIRVFSTLKDETGVPLVLQFWNPPEPNSSEAKKLMKDPMFFSTISQKPYETNQLLEALNDFHQLFRNVSQAYNADSPAFQASSKLHNMFITEIHRRWGEPLSREFKNLRRARVDPFSQSSSTTSTTSTPQSKRSRSAAEIVSDEDEAPSKSKRQRTTSTTTSNRGGSRAKRVQSESEDDDEMDNLVDSDEEKDDEDDEQGSDSDDGGGAKGARRRTRDDDGPQVEKILGDKMTEKTVKIESA